MIDKMNTERYDWYAEAKESKDKDMINKIDARLFDLEELKAEVEKAK